VAVARIIGIDLGTINTCAAISDEHGPQILHHADGLASMPSYVAFVAGGRVIAGTEAKRQAYLNPRRTLFGLKRLAGRSFESPEIQQLRPWLPYELVQGAAGQARVRVDDRDYALEEVQAVLLDHVRQLAEEYTGDHVVDAVLAVPVHFDAAQCGALTEAARLAGLCVRALVSEPVATLLAVHPTGEWLAVVNCGASLEVAILRRDGETWQTCAVARDLAVGGGEFDGRIVAGLRAVFRAEHGFDLSVDAVVMQRLEDAAEKAKQELSERAEFAVDLPVVAHGPRGQLDLRAWITRVELQTATADLLARAERTCEAALLGARLARGQLDTLIFGGGMSQMPALRETVEAALGLTACSGVSAREVVSLGAASLVLPGGTRS
jgi:molecular chaperone DnaK